MSETEFLPCPRCGSVSVEWTNSRDLDILNQWVCCDNCDLHTFHVNTMAFLALEDMDYQSSLMKYNAWVKTNPKRYYDEEWK
jgi:Zn finger protein HypA/HybF involved in hydrogenase expression